MIIGIDASRSVRKTRHGSENYSLDIIRALLQLPSPHRFILYSPTEPNEPIGTSNNFEWRILPFPRLWSQVRLVQELRRQSPDVLFVPAHVVPLLSHLPTVVTIHSLAFKYYPLSFSARERWYQNFTTSVSVRKARQIIVPSQINATDLQKFYPGSQGKTTVIPPGYNPNQFWPAATQSGSPLHGPYILYVGRIEERKNIRLLIDAFMLLARSEPKIHLVLAGKDGYGFERVQAHLQTLPTEIRRRIFQPGFLPNYDLVRYLQHAAIFAFPSRYEGFAFAALEAMACGIPIVASNNSSLPELTGDAAILLPPLDPVVWAKAFTDILTQPTLRQQLKEQTHHQVQQFAWTKTAAKTLEVLENAIA